MIAIPAIRLSGVFLALASGGVIFAYLGFEQAVAQGIVPGPRVLASTKAIVATGSYGAPPPRTHSGRTRAAAVAPDTASEPTRHASRDAAETDFLRRTWR